MPYDLCNAQRAIDGKVEVARATRRDVSLYANPETIEIMGSTRSLDPDCSLKATMEQTDVRQLTPLSHCAMHSMPGDQVSG